MTIVDQVGQSTGNLIWSGLGQFLGIFIIFFIVLVVFLTIAFFMWKGSYNIKVTVYQPMGQVKFTPEELVQINKDIQEGKIPKSFETIKFDQTKKKRTKGKFMTVKGNPYFGLFMPLKRIEAIPLDLMYSDGVHLLQLSKNIYTPIPRPSFIINVGQNVSISVADHNRWITWNNMMAERVNLKYQDIDMQRKQTLYFVIGIVAMVVIGGLILWFIYSSAKRGMDVNALIQQLQNSVSGGKPLI